jgi:hypothetical protein
VLLLLAKAGNNRRPLITSLAFSCNLDLFNSAFNSLDYIAFESKAINNYCIEANGKETGVAYPGSYPRISVAGLREATQNTSCDRGLWVQK